MSSFKFQESVRSKVYVAMDFTRESGGRVLDNPKDIKACDKAGAGSTSLLAASQVAAACKDGYVPFRYDPFLLSG